MSDETLLVISGLNLPPYAVRGITQTLTPIQGQAQLRRTINGVLDDLSPSQFRKYASTITCTDQQTPALDGIWEGLFVTVDCVAELAYRTADSDIDMPGREVVASREEGDYTFYRPRLNMRVTRWQVTTDEYGAEVGWQLDLEEI